jgi:hypothetical protein
MMSTETVTRFIEALPIGERPVAIRGPASAAAPDATTAKAPPPVTAVNIDAVPNG